MYDAKYVTSNCFDIDEVLTREKFMYESSHECADGMQAIFSAIKDSMRGIVTSLVFIVAAIISLGIINANNDASPGANIAMFLIIFLWLLPSIAVIIVTIVKSLSPMH